MTHCTRRIAPLKHTQTGTTRIATENIVGLSEGRRLYMLFHGELWPLMSTIPSTVN